jgi:adenylate cyclase, class 2
MVLHVVGKLNHVIQRNVFGPHAAVVRVPVRTVAARIVRLDGSRFKRLRRRNAQPANKRPSRTGSSVSLRLARPEGLEPPAYWFEASRSIQLSYGRVRIHRIIDCGMTERGPVEIEIKLRVEGGVRAAADLLAKHGYQARKPRTLQADQLFDLEDNALRESGRLLRLRLAGGASTLTYKGPPMAGPHKSREELETQVEDSDALRSIFLRLGYRPGFRYEKYRTVFQRPGEGSGEIGLDETPIGVFLELEGPADWIDRTAQRLGFSSADYITTSYGSLYREYLKLHGGPADMVFVETAPTDDPSPASDAGKGSKKERP